MREGALTPYEGGVGSVADLCLNDHARQGGDRRACPRQTG